MPCPRGVSVPTARTEKLVLSLPPDPGLARLVRLATLHFLRQNGVRAMEARRSARSVEQRSKAVLKAAADAARRGNAHLDLVLTSGTRSIQVVIRRGNGRPASLLEVKRDGAGPA